MPASFNNFFSVLVTHLVNFALSLRRLLKLTGRLISPAVPVLSLLAMAGSVLLAGLLTVPAAKGVAYILLLGSLLFLFKIITFTDLRWLKSLIYKRPHR